MEIQVISKDFCILLHYNLLVGLLLCSGLSCHPQKKKKKKDKTKNKMHSYLLRALAQVQTTPLLIQLPPHVPRTAVEARSSSRVHVTHVGGLARALPASGFSLAQHLLLQPCGECTTEWRVSFSLCLFPVCNCDFQIHFFKTPIGLPCDSLPHV